MWDKTYYRPLSCSSRTSLPKYKSRCDDFIHGFNYSEPRTRLFPQRTLQDSSSEGIPDKSSSLSLAKSRTQIQKSKKKQRIAQNRRRIELLSRPKVIRNECRIFKTSSMTQPEDIKKTQDPSISAETSVISNRLREVTPRLLHLAEPKVHVPTAFTPQNPLGEVSEKALTAKASKRIEELAEPKKLPFPMIKDPFKVNPNALKATCSSRTEELARPKALHPPFSQLILQSYLNRVFIPPEN